MDIRKADAKGRVTGFTPGTHYEVHFTPLGYVLKPLAAGGYTQASPYAGTVHEGDFIVTGYEKGYD